MSSTPRILLTGATGYVGGRLLRALEAEGLPVRCLARRPEALARRTAPTTEVALGDLHDEASLGPALAGIEVAYYLVHSMGDAGSFQERERRAAENFARAARAAGVQRIVYLGGLAPKSARAVSPHLRSRLETGRILRESGVPTIELRCSIVIGSGSASFELVRSLVEKLPLMVTPRWTRTLAQPIAIEDLLAYLLAARTLPTAGSACYEIGGAERVSYLGLMLEYARQRGLRRWILPVPFLSPWISSLWLGLVTPLYARVGRKLIDSVRHETTVQDESARAAFAIRPRGVREAIARALRNEDSEIAATRWSDALSSGSEPRREGPVRYARRCVDSRVREVAAPVELAFEPIRCIGGTQGWYFGDVLWRLRGFLDLLVGGVGMRRGRRHPRDLGPGDALDFWRVEAFEAPRTLRLAAEMKLPGRAWLVFEVEPTASGSRVRQTALFDPVGLGGRLYWYALLPLHLLIFAGMLRSIAKRAERAAALAQRPSPA
jgi:uncharacterized protein YbjT (DUF2867 family)